MKETLMYHFHVKVPHTTPEPPNAFHGAPATTNRQLVLALARAFAFALVLLDRRR